ncbi:MAG: biopolymer transporter ExbD [Fibrobacter sp.]|jgi:biopolymer transport protein ExbD|nr:biopolymer transporter ExbD [Fibrobacter sp.]MDY6370580.1 biopolymer transporter ExbD [Fibrobacter sp.]MDY6389139.1 biopolymer transporter ExbD [Fibrobacter sp.]
MARKKHRISLDMTPLIDCVFLLLVFFLVTSVFKQDKSVLKLLLPETTSEVKQEVSEGLFIELSEMEMAVNGEVVNLETLRAKGAAIQNKKAPVALKIDKKTPYERVAQVLDVLQMEKIYNIQFVNELKKE